MSFVSVQHAYREDNQWCMTVPELPDRAVARGRPLHRESSADGTTEDRPGNTVATIEMPAITSKMPAAFTPQPVPDADTGTGDPATTTDLLQVNQNWWVTVPSNRDDVRMPTHKFTRQALAWAVVSQRFPAKLMLNRRITRG